jgi:3'(2'), 5'-bisphosphate nucleotidase
MPATPHLTELLIAAVQISVKAGKEILRIYDSAFEVELKGDQSPLTEADKASHELIFLELSKFGYPILSEEGKSIPFEERSVWKSYWCVDPLDGTKEFIKRNGEFTINIAFMEKDTPIMGVIYQPVNGIAFAAIVGGGVYRISEQDATALSSINLEQYRIQPGEISQSEQIKVVASRSHRSVETEDFIEDLKKKGSKVFLVNSGSALKFCLLAEGKADIYPRFAPTMEWDTAAGHAILKACGRNIILYPGTAEMKYNKPSLVNDWFIAR